MQVVPQRRKSLAIVLIVLGPLVLATAAICAMLGAVTVTWTGLALDVKTIDSHSDGTVRAGDGDEVTLFADATVGVTAESCTVTGPYGASVELHTDGVPGISQTQDGVTWEAFAWFEGYGTDEFGPLSSFAFDCGGATVVGVQGVKSQVEEGQSWFIAAGVLAFIGVAMIVAGIWWLVAVVRYNRRMRDAFAQ